MWEVHSILQKSTRSKRHTGQDKSGRTDNTRREMVDRGAQVNQACDVCGATDKTYHCIDMSDGNVCFIFINRWFNKFCSGDAE